MFVNLTSMEISLALDWTSNTLHIGFLVAQAQGLYQRLGLAVTLRSPATDQYATTPARQVAEGTADLAIAPSESVISYRTSRQPVPLVAIAALAQRDTSAIVTLANSKLMRPAQLDGHTYASYGARYEDDIVRAMIRQDGGRGDVRSVQPPKLGIWETLLSGQADATWVFMPWEGVEAAQKGIVLNAFSLDDYQIPYRYSPVLLTHADTLERQGNALRGFVQASAEGYRLAVAQPDLAVAALTAANPAVTADFARQSMDALRPALLDDDGQWGVMAPARWRQFAEWLVQQQLLRNGQGEPLSLARFDVNAIFTNELFNRS